MIIILLIVKLKLKIEFNIYYSHVLVTTYKINFTFYHSIQELLSNWASPPSFN